MASPVYQPPFGIELPLRGYDDLFDAMVTAVPSGTFYDFRRPIVMWSSKPTNFIFETNNYGVPIKVEAERLGNYQQSVDQNNLVTTAFFVPYNPRTSFSLTLGIGINRIIATEQIPGGRQALLEVVATPNTIIFEPFGKEIYEYAVRIVTAQKDAIYSKYATRLLDQVITFQDLMPDFQALKILSTKLLVRGMVHFPATEIGVRNVIESFCLNTPIYKDQRPTIPYQVERSNIYRAVEQSSGAEAHVWFPNLAVSRWIAFTKMAASFKNLYELNEVTDTKVKVTYKGQEQTHLFDFNSPGSNFLNLSLNDCFNNIDVSWSSGFILNHKICLWTYFFDEHVQGNKPIGQDRAGFDYGVPFDQDLYFDADPTDPFTDGWVGWSLSGRFEQDYPKYNALDTHVVPSITYPGTACVYPGPYTQMMNTIRTDVDLLNNITYDPLNTNWGDYAAGPAVALFLEFTTTGPLTAGIPELGLLKFVDAKNMTNISSTGTVYLEEVGGIGQNVPIAAGYQYFYFTPTKAGPATTWLMTDGVFLNESTPKEVLPGPFAGFKISIIPDQSVGVPFTVSVQAVDQYGNNQTEVGINNKVSIHSTGGFLPATVTPNYVNLIDGFATVELTMLNTGTGVLEFSIGSISQNSNFFTVT